MYRNDPINPITGYIGSSNLTLSGLKHQGELNVDVLDHDAAKKLAKWWEEPQFAADFAEWQTGAKNAVDDWFQKGMEQIKRMIESPRFKAASARGRIDFDPESFVKNSKLNFMASSFQ